MTSSTVEPPVAGRVAVDGPVGLYVDRWPGGETAFLLVHGLASNAQLWWASAARLSALGHACAAVDQRGHGRSDKPDDGYTMDRACADLVALLGHLRDAEPGWGGRVVVAGQSWGANVALELGYRHPDLLAGVVCVDGGTIELSRTFPDWEKCAEVLAPPRLSGLPLEDMERYAREAHADWPESGRRAMLANFEVRPDGTVAPWLTFDRHMKLLRALWEHRPSTRYPGMRVPVLIVPADRPDREPGPAFSDGKRRSVEEAVAALPRGKAHWFSPADHDIHAQFPDELAELLHAEATAPAGVLA